MLKGILIARQPGTLHAFEPLRKHFLSQGMEVRTFHLNPNLQDQNWHYLQDFNEFSKLNLQADFLVTGTSLQSREDSEYWQWAELKKIKSFAFVDQWVNIAPRFENILRAPKVILIPEECLRQEVAQLGLSSQIEVVSTPVWDELRHFTSLVGTQRKENFAVFATEPLASPEGFTKYRNKNGYDDMDSLELCLEALVKATNHNWILNLKLHPIDTKERVEKKLSTLASKFQSIQISWEQLSKEDVFQKAAYVFGNRSMFLVECSLLGIPVVSFQPNRKTSSLATDREGIEVVEHLKTAPRALERAKKNNMHLPSQNSCDLMTSLIKNLK